VPRYLAVTLGTAWEDCGGFIISRGRGQREVSFVGALLVQLPSPDKPSINSLFPHSTLWNIARSQLLHPAFLPMLSFFSLLLFSLVVLDVAQARLADSSPRRLAPSLRSIVRRQTSQNSTTTNSTSSNPNVTLSSAGIVPLVLASDKQ